MNGSITRWGCALPALSLLLCLILGVPAGAAEPCCRITAIDAPTGIVSARDRANGRVIRFKVANAALLRSLKVGQSVYADSGTRKVSLDGAAPCCAILNVRPAEPAGQPQATGQAMQSSGKSPLAEGKRGLPPGAHLSPARE